MTVHPIDTAALSKRAGRILFAEGPEHPAATARETCVLLDLLAAAEHRATRAEAQSAIRGRAVVIYRERAREAEAEVKRLSWECGHLADKYDTDTEELRQEVDQAEAERDDWREVALQERGDALDALEQIKARDAQIKAVQDVLDNIDTSNDPALHDGFADIRLALEG